MLWTKKWSSPETIIYTWQDGMLSPLVKIPMHWHTTFRNVIKARCLNASLWQLRFLRRFLHFPHVLFFYLFVGLYFRRAAVKATVLCFSFLSASTKLSTLIFVIVIFQLNVLKTVWNPLLFGINERLKGTWPAVWVILGNSPRHENVPLDSKCLRLLSSRRPLVCLDVVRHLT